MQPSDVIPAQAGIQALDQAAMQPSDVIPAQAGIQVGH